MCPWLVRIENSNGEKQGSTTLVPFCETGFAKVFISDPFVECALQEMVLNAPKWG